MAVYKNGDSIPGLLREIQSDGSLSWEMSTGKGSVCRVETIAEDVASWIVGAGCYYDQVEYQPMSEKEVAEYLESADEGAILHHKKMIEYNYYTCLWDAIIRHSSIVENYENQIAARDDLKLDLPDNNPNWVQATLASTLEHMVAGSLEHALEAHYLASQIAETLTEAHENMTDQNDPSVQHLKAISLSLEYLKDEIRDIESSIETTQDYFHNMTP